MRKFILTTVLALGVANCALAADFSGKYQCHLTDHTDGPFDATLVLKLNPKASFLTAGYASYDIAFHVAGIPYEYTGIAAARGNDLALYFESTGEKKNPDDRGVGIASVILDQDKSGKNGVSIHKFYYENSYKGKSNYGFEECTKA
ncbi:MAG: hypothetical protein K0R48_356 [Gammaproteobacteria bacterium]|jgi:hypothetical protein|nr:hypothetical protein [Gammaproteobacteria bacterium]